MKNHLMKTLFVLLILGCNHKAPSPWQFERHYPPLVFTSKAVLDCSISSTEPGRQILRTTSGQGFTFDAAMLPITDGTVRLSGDGMHYEFTAFPTAQIPARFSGLGEGTITELRIEVEVDVKRFQQSAGPGTMIRFRGSDIDTDGAYVELTGLFIRKRDTKPFPFRVLFGSSATGEGEVLPSNSATETGLRFKRVVLGTNESPATVTTALYEPEEDVRKLH